MLCDLLLAESTIKTDSINLETIIETVESRESKIQDIRCKIESRTLMQEYNGIKLPLDSLIDTQIERYAKNFTQRYVEYFCQTVSSNKTLMMMHNAWSTPGDKLYGFNFSDNSGHITRLNGSDFPSYQLLPLLGHTCHPRRPATLSQILKSADRKSLHNNVENINGFNAYLIEYFITVPNDIPMSFKVWICPEKDFSPVRIESYKYGGTYLLRRVNIKSFSEPEQGIILPQEAEITLWSMIGANVKLKQGITKKEVFNMPDEEQAKYIEGWEVRDIQRIRCTVVEAIVNKGIPNQEFIIDFPIGSRIWDESTNSTRIISKALNKTESK